MCSCSKMRGLEHCARSRLCSTVTSNSQRHVLDDLAEDLWRALEGAVGAAVNDERLVPPPSDPMAVARQFVAERYTEIGGVIALRHHRGVVPSLRR